ncbi:MAG: hypothetical protein RLZ81_1100 [Pseudomonadota bacterium]
MAAIWATPISTRIAAATSLIWMCCPSGRSSRRLPTASTSIGTASGQFRFRLMPFRRPSCTRLNNSGTSLQPAPTSFATATMRRHCARPTLARSCAVVGWHWFQRRPWCFTTIPANYRARCLRRRYMSCQICVTPSRQPSANWPWFHPISCHRNVALACCAG